AIKSFLSEHSVYFNRELESRRGKKLRIGDKVDIPDMNIENKGVKKDKSKPASSPKSQQAPRFPGR
ncbi:RNA-binding S4 domain-containing protein, partial [Streptococcus pneumoniae]|uniref:RNA-binding S4 domain-containing protein n=1 Tax=Streptococcus pneumoniae TaxID=1313 RepID=UPI000B20E5EC